MEEVDLEVALKVIIVGNGMVGKTTMLNKYLHNEFGSKYQRTIGSDFKEKTLTLQSGQELSLLLWDMAGQEQYSAITKGYYKGASAVVYVFSSIDKASFQAIPKWIDGARAEVGKNVVEVLVQTKCDLKDQWVVSEDEAEQLATQYNLPLFKVSVKHDDMSGLFNYISALCSERNVVNNGAITTLDQHSVTASQAQAQSGSSSPQGNSNLSSGSGKAPRNNRNTIQENVYDNDNNAMDVGGNTSGNSNNNNNNEHNPNDIALTRRTKKKSKCVIM